ncbi:MAG: IS1634 family transposase [Acidobacteria bacterium]|nr:IS1634 family transposase [Acidobacteriota bacterium]
MVSMYIESVPNRASPPAILLRESFRDGGRVKKRTLANLSKLPTAAINALRRILRGERLVSPDDAFSCLRSLPHGHVAAVLATVRKLGLPALLARSPGRHRDLVLALLVARVIDAQSKLATARALTPESAVSTLGEMLDLGTVDPKELYAAMDWLVERQTAIEQRLAKRHLQEHTLVLYDLTSSYVEGTHCELAQRGHSRDRKKGTLQIVFGLLCTATGCPVAVEVFEGSTSDPNTVASQVDKIRTRFGLHRVVLVGDRGMLTAARIREDLAGVDGLRWITTLRAPTIRKLVAAGTVTPSLFDQRDLAEVTSEDFPGERLIVCRNPLLAAERQRKRHELLAATEKELEPIVAATRRRNDPLRGAADIGIRVGKVINHYKVAKHFVTTITDESFTFRRDEDKIADEQQLDGLYIVRSNVESEQFDATQTVRAYKDLAKVERAFRSLKTVDLKVRPIHHRRADRVRAHVLLCMLAYYVEWHMRQALKPLLFDDHDPAAAEQQRASVVQKAKRSPAARAKAARKRTADDLPVHSFRTLLADLGTLTANTMRVVDGDATFTLLTKPTPGQQRSLELLGVSPQM